MDGVSLANVTQYITTIRDLQYCKLILPKISLSMNKLCQVFHSLTNVHCIEAKKLLRYLKRTQDHGMFLQHSNSLALTSHTNIDWASYSNDMRSTEDIVFIYVTLLFLGVLKNR